MRGFRLSRMFLRAAIRASTRTRYQQQRRKIQSKRTNAVTQLSRSSRNTGKHQPYMTHGRHPIQPSPLMTKTSQLTYRQRRQQNEARIQAWYEAHPRGKTALGCGLLIVVLLLCTGLTTAAYGSFSSFQNQIPCLQLYLKHLLVKVKRWY